MQTETRQHDRYILEQSGRFITPILRIHVNLKRVSRLHAHATSGPPVEKKKKISECQTLSLSTTLGGHQPTVFGDLCGGRVAFHGDEPQLQVPGG